GGDDVQIRMGFFYPGVEYSDLYGIVIFKQIEVKQWPADALDARRNFSRRDVVRIAWSRSGRCLAIWQIIRGFAADIGIDEILFTVKNHFLDQRDALHCRHQRRGKIGGEAGTGFAIDKHW